MTGISMAYCYSKAAAASIKDRAFATLSTDPELLALWNEAKTDEERELLIVWVISNQAYDDGWDDAMDRNAEYDAGENI